MKKTLPGFALLEATMALIVLGIIASFTFPMITSFMQYEKTKRTADSQEQIMRALAGYALIHDKLPAPARPGLPAPTQCKGTACIGIVPYMELGIPEKLAKDGYGHWYTYVVQEYMTGNNNIQHNIGAQIENKSLQYIIEAKSDSIHFKDITTNIPVHEDRNNNPNKIKNQLAILLISHGPSGGGAFSDDGSEKIRTDNKYEAINSAENLNFITGDAEGFNHQVFWVTKNQFVACYAQTPLFLKAHRNDAMKKIVQNEGKFTKNEKEINLKDKLKLERQQAGLRPSLPVQSPNQRNIDPGGENKK